MNMNVNDIPINFKHFIILYLTHDDAKKAIFVLIQSYRSEMTSCYYRIFQSKPGCEECLIILPRLAIGISTKIQDLCHGNVYEL